MIEERRTACGAAQDRTGRFRGSWQGVILLVLCGVLLLETPAAGARRQLINVLRGDMSFVGPRPERPPFVSELSRKVPFYASRHSSLGGYHDGRPVRIWGEAEAAVTLSTPSPFVNSSGSPNSLLRHGW